MSTDMEGLPVSGIKRVDGFYFDTWTGLSSSNTAIPYYTNVIRSTNNGVLLSSNSSTTGNSFTALVPCQLDIAANCTGQLPFSITINETSGTATTDAVAATQRLSYGYSPSATNDTFIGSVSASVRLKKGDVVKFHYWPGGGLISPTSSGKLTVTGREL